MHVQFLNVEVTSGGDIIYNSWTRPSVGEVATLWGLGHDVFSRWIIDKKKILPSLQPNNFFVVPKEDFFSLRWKDMSLIMDPFRFMHFNLPHTNDSLRMTFSRNRPWSTLWRMVSSMHVHTMKSKLCKSSDINSRNYGWTFRFHNLSIQKLPCPL